MSRRGSGSARGGVVVIKHPAVPNVELWGGSDGSRRQPGDLEVTPHHFIFRGGQETLQFLHSSIESVEKQRLQPTGTLLTVRLKNFRRVPLAIPIDSVASATLEALNALKSPASLDALHAFVHKPRFQVSDAGSNGWSLYDDAAEMDRLLGRTRGWRVTHANKGYKIAPSYPEVLRVPEDVEDSVIEDVAKYRQDGRLPDLAYVHENRGVILRAGQPLYGRQGRCYEDERLFRAILECTDADKGVIVDTRSQGDASSHKSKGGGSENESTYYNWTRVFADIPTGSDQRSSFQKFCQACHDGSLATSAWLGKVESSGWLRILRNTFSTAVVVANIVHKEGRPVVVHGRYGWDETCVVLVLAQLLLDPHYRTVKGFQTLLEKEFVKAGHPFHDRAALTGGPKKGASLPTMCLLVDCMYQLMRQFPCTFEFNEMMLVSLFEHAMGSSYGTFLCNNEAERAKAGVAEKCVSLWDFLAQPSERGRCLNTLYDGTCKDHLRASFKPQCMEVWRYFYCRWSLDVSTQDEASTLMMFRRNRADALHAEVDRQQTRIAKLQALLAARGDAAAAKAEVVVEAAAAKAEVVAEVEGQEPTEAVGEGETPEAKPEETAGAADGAQDGGDPSKGTTDDTQPSPKGAHAEPAGEQKTCSTSPDA